MEGKKKFPLIPSVLREFFFWHADPADDADFILDESIIRAIREISVPYKFSRRGAEDAEFLLNAKHTKLTKYSPRQLVALLKFLKLPKRFSVKILSLDFYQILSDEGATSQ